MRYCREVHCEHSRISLGCRDYHLFCWNRVGQSIYFTVTPVGYTFTGFTSSDPSMVPDEAATWLWREMWPSQPILNRQEADRDTGGLLEVLWFKGACQSTALKMKRIDSSIAFNYGYDLSPIIDKWEHRSLTVILACGNGDYIFNLPDDGVKFL